MEQPTVILAAIYNIIGIHGIVLNLENQQIPFFKKQKAIGVFGDIFTCEPRATVGHIFQ